MATLKQLADPQLYHACDWDLKRDAAARAYWVGAFLEHLESLVARIQEEYSEATAERIAAFRDDYASSMRAYQATPQRFERIDVLQMTRRRRELLLQWEFPDPYRAVKRRENDTALRLLPKLLRELDALEPQAVFERLAAGLLAGNVFDLGSVAILRRYPHGISEFRQTLDTLPGRPWFIDDAGVFRERWQGGGAYRHVAFFVDNAGSDIVLGGLPLVRWMLQKGARVTLAANSQPALNDVIAPELENLLDPAARHDELLTSARGSGALRVVASGGTTPLLDLTDLSAECALETQDADLIVLHGSGRALESNYRAQFTCDTLRTAVIKDAAVAGRLGATLFDCVFQLQSSHV